MRVPHALQCACLLYAIWQPLTALGADEPSAAARFWEQGQRALRQGMAEQAIHYYEKSLETDPRFQRSHLGLAAAYVQINDGVRARAQFAAYLAAYPENLS